MSNDLLLDTIQKAIIEGFFHQTPVWEQNYNGGHGGMRYVGGHGMIVIEKALGTLNLDEIKQMVLDNLIKDKETIAKSVSDNIVSVLVAKAYNTWGDEKVRPEIRAALAEAIKAVLIDSDVFKKALEGRLGIVDQQKITINIVLG